MNLQSIDPSEPQDVSYEMLRAFAKGCLDEADEDRIAMLLQRRPDLAAVVASISADPLLKKMGDQTLTATEASISSQIDAADAWSGPETEDASGVDLPRELAELHDFKLLKEIGRGGMGVVYLVKHRITARKEVLKVLNERLMTNPVAHQRFMQEISCISSLNHDTIVKCHTVLKLSSCIVLCMEYVPGVNLHQLIHKNGPLPIRIACGIAREVCRGLQHAKNGGLVHRDIKPSNIMLYRSDGKIRTKILDFGLARREATTGITDDGLLLGTLEYIAPEQSFNANAVDIRADIYSLGCTLYHMLVGHPPFSGSSGALILAHAEAVPPRLDRIRPEIPSQLADVTARMLAKRPQERFAEPAEVAALLERISTEYSAATSPVDDVVQRVEPVETTDEDGLSRKDTEGDSDTKQTVEQIRRQPGPSQPAVGVRQDEAMVEVEESIGSDRSSSRIVLSDAAESGRVQPSIGGRNPRKRVQHKFVVAVGMVFVVVACFLTLRLKTKKGVLLIENLPPDAAVTIDGDRVSLRWNGQTASAQVTPGDRNVIVVSNGMRLFGSVVEFSSGETAKISARMESPQNVRSGDEVTSSKNETETKGQDQEHLAKESERELAIRRLEQTLIQNAWRYRDNRYPPGDTCRFRPDGTFHKWRWRYRVVGPHEMRVFFGKEKIRPNGGIRFRFNDDLTQFQGSWSDPKGLRHTVVGTRI